MLEIELGYMPDEIKKMDVDPYTPIYPCMRVLPMGFSWAFHLAHMSHMELAKRVLPDVPFLRDRHAAPRLGTTPGTSSTAMLVYADSNNHLGTTIANTGEDQRTMIDALHDKNLATHDVTEPSTLAESLCVRIDGLGGLVQPTAHRDWRLDRALQQLGRRPYMTGEQLQVVVGRMTCRALINRNLMAILRHSYIFIEKSYTKRQRLWPSVAAELERFRVLMPRGTACFKAEWDGEMLCADACLTGYAVMQSSLPSAMTAAAGRHDERWRFRRTDGALVAPRQSVFHAQDVFDDPLTVKPAIEGEVIGDIEEDASFPNVPVEFLDKSHWHILWNTPVHHREPVHMI